MMDAVLSPRLLNIETLIFPLFLAMLLLVQLSRASEPGTVVQHAKAHVVALAMLFPLLAVVFGSFLYSVSPLFAIELAAGMVLALIHPVNALCLFVHMLFLRPWDIVPDNPLFLALPRVLAFTCVLSWAFHPARHGKPNSQSRRALGLLLAFGLWLFLSTFIAANVGQAQASWFDTFFKSMIVFVMCAYFIDNRRSLSEFKYTLLISIFAMAVLGFYRLANESSVAGVSDRLYAVSMLDPNDLAAVSIMAVPLALALVMGRQKGLSQRAIGFLFFGVALLTIWYSQSRGALLALAAQVVLFQFLTTFRRRRILAFLCAGLIAAGYLVLLGTLRRSAADLEESKETRLTYWATALRMTAHHPLLGVGFDQYPETYDEYSSSLQYESGKRTAHSSWLLAFAESGLVGGMLFAAFFLTVFQTAWRNRDQKPEHLYALGGYAVAMTFLSHTYLLFPYLLYGLILASDSIQQERLHAV